MGRVKIDGFRRLGFIQDTHPYDIPPEAFDEVKNVRFNNQGAEAFRGEREVMQGATISPLWLKVYPPVDLPIWVYADLSSIWGYTLGAHTNLTRLSGPYAAQPNQRWTGDIFQGLGIFNNSVDVPQVWNNFDVGTKLLDLPNWPPTIRARAVRPFGNFLIAMYIMEGGQEYPFRYRWSHPAAPGTVPSSWALADPSKDSGENDIAETTDYIVDGLTMGTSFMMYKQRSVYAIDYVNRPFVLAHRQVLATKGILWRDCVQAFPGGHFVFGIDDIYTHQGRPNSDVSLIEGKLRDWLFNQIDSNNFMNCYTVKYERRNEIWACFPEVGEAYPNLALVWNYLTGGIGVRELRNAPFIYPGPVEDPDPDTAVWDITSYRFLEDDGLRLLEDGTIRLLEDAVDG